MCLYWYDRCILDAFFHVIKIGRGILFSERERGRWERECYVCVDRFLSRYIYILYIYILSSRLASFSPFIDPADRERTTKKRDRGQLSGRGWDGVCFLYSFIYI